MFNSMPIKRIFLLGFMSIWRHRLRSSLTILGIVFGVCSVISMLAIGEGASYEAQEQIKRLGSQNIIIKSVRPPLDDKAEAALSPMLEYGLTYKDVANIKATIPDITVIVPQKTIRATAASGFKQTDVNIIATVPLYPDTANKKILTGRFFDDVEMYKSKNVCVISDAIKKTLFTLDDPIGRTIKAKGDYYTIIGVLEETKTETLSTSGKRSNLNIYVPLTTARLFMGEIVILKQRGSMTVERVEVNETIIQVKSASMVMRTAEVVRGILQRLHRDVDYDIIIPLELLRQAENTKRIFNIVLGSIAAISLLVGGIGIMNIMLATVTERTREIGIRRALGARKQDIIIQFLTETILLSGCGGVIGVVIGVLIPLFITYFAHMKTIVRLWSLTGAFGISLFIGILFGIYPAYRAAVMNPIKALRHE